MSHHLMDLLCWLWKCGARKDHRDVGHIVHDWMIECYKVYYGMSYDKAVAWLYCRRTCNRTLITSIIDSMCINLYGNWYSVPWIPYVWYAHGHTWHVQQREIYANLLLIHQWRLLRLPHIPSISLSCVSYICVCVYMFCSCSADSIRKRRGGEIVIRCYYRAIKFRIFYP